MLTPNPSLARVAITVTASDPEGDSLSYQWTASPTAGVTVGNGKLPPLPYQSRTYTFTTSVDDGHNNPVTDTVTVEVNQTASTLGIQPRRLF